MAGPPPDANWIIEPIVEADSVVLFTGDSGAGKSIICASMILSIVRGEPWCGYPTTKGRVLYIDNENSARLVDKRLRMLGFTAEDVKSLRYFSRLGVQLGSGQWLERTLDEVDDFKPSLVVLDTVSSTTTATANDNDAIARLYATVLRPLASETCAVIAQHHERKPAQGIPVDGRNAALGGVHWRTQADTMMRIERKGDVVQRGNIRKFSVVVSMPKNRDGETMHLPLAICSEHEGKRTLRGWIERREER